MNKFLMVSPKSENVMHINYHYTQFGEVIDYLNKFFPDQIIALDEDVDSRNVFDIIKQNNIEKVVMQVNYENANNAFEMSEKIKKESSNIPILAYGNVPIMLPKLFLNSKFDAIHSSGDAEVSIKSFFRYYNANESTEKLQESLRGTSIVTEQELIPTQSGQFIAPDNWGISKQDDVPIDEYDRIKGKDRFVINISRGCPFQCPHCLIQLTEGKLERRRSINNLKEAISTIQEKYKHIKVWAANFTLNKKYVSEFCEMMDSNFKDITWECATRIDLLNDNDMLNEMYKAGCRQISIGIESLNNNELIHTKDFTPDEISTVIDNVQQAGIQVKGCVMLGMPNQTKESIVRTFKFLKDRQVIIRPTIYTPYHHLTENIANISYISRYNRKTYPNSNVPGISHKQLIEIVKNPNNYEEILNSIQNKTIILKGEYDIEI